MRHFRPLIIHPQPGPGETVFLPGRPVLADVCGNVSIMGRNDLRTVVPVDLVAIILLGIVRCRNHNACLAAQLGDGKSHVRCGTDVREEMHLDTL